jgi:YHS domain-containing protein
MSPSPLALLAALVAGFAAPRQEAPAKQEAPVADAAVVAQQLPSYPLVKCPISDEPLDAMGEPLSITHEGRLVRLCCKGCLKGFKKDPAAAIAKIDQAVVAAQKASYPLETCAVSGEKLAEMGEPVDHVVGTRLVRLCCKDCIPGVQKDAGKVLAKVDEALIAAQLPTYSATECPVSGKKLEGEGANIVYGTRLVRLCCKECPAAFKKEPEKYLAKLDGGSKQAGSK